MPLGVETPLSTLNPRLPLLIVDVDEVLGLFVAAFERFIVERGYEMRLERFTLFGSLYRPGEASPLPLETGAALYNAFFHSGVEDMEPTPGAAEALSTLSKGANIVILTNAPDHCRAPRARWLRRHGMDYPMQINEGAKGVAVAALAAGVIGPTAFVDDLISNLDSAKALAPHVSRFQLVADPRLRDLAPTARDQHTRIDDWPSLAIEIAESLDLNPDGSAKPIDKTRPRRPRGSAGASPRRRKPLFTWRRR